MILVYGAIALLLLLSALFSGLNLGLMSLDPYTLKRKVNLGNKEARAIYTLRKQGNLLLCSLLIGNCAVNATMALLLGNITTGLIAGITATGLIVVFGEIVPQAVFSRHALRLGAKTIWLAWIFVIIAYPIAKPISFLLDKALGGELPTIFSKREIRALLREQHKLGKELQQHEVEIIEKSLGFSDKMVKEVMTPRQNVLFLKPTDMIGQNLLQKLQEHGHSRVPVFDYYKKRVVGILFAKDLLFLDPGDGIMVRDIMRKQVGKVRDTDHLDKVLRLFRYGRVHLFVVVNAQNKMTGIITLEDVLEEIVGEIVDEHDRWIDMRKAVAK